MLAITTHNRGVSIMLELILGMISDVLIGTLGGLVFLCTLTVILATVQYIKEWRNES